MSATAQVASSDQNTQAYSGAVLKPPTATSSKYPSKSVKRSATTMGAEWWMRTPVICFTSQDLKTSPILPGVTESVMPER